MLSDTEAERRTRCARHALHGARGGGRRGRLPQTRTGGGDGDGLRCICATARRLATGGWCWTACRQARGVVDDRWTMSGIWKHFIRENEGRARKAGGTPFGTEKPRFYWGFRVFLLGAGGGTRTLTYSRTADFESAAAAITPLRQGPWMERAKGIEPSWPAWKAGTLPLSYARRGRTRESISEVFSFVNRPRGTNLWYNLRPWQKHPDWR